MHAQQASLTGSGVIETPLGGVCVLQIDKCLIMILCNLIGDGSEYCIYEKYVCRSSRGTKSSAETECFSNACH